MSKTLQFQTIQFRVSTVSMSKTVLFQVIQFSISSLVIFNPWIGPYQVVPFPAKADLGAEAKKGTLHSTKLQHYWNLTNRLFSVISRTPVVCGGVLPLYRDAVGVFCSPSQLGQDQISKENFITYAICEPASLFHLEPNL